MSEVYLAEYGRAKTIHFSLFEVDGVDLRVDAADSGANCVVMTDEAAEGTATNDFVDEGTGYSLALTAAELTGARITVYVIDAATKVWLDKTIQIETYGHPSSAHPNLSPYWTNGALNDGTPSSASVFTVDGFTEATADHLIGGYMVWTSGANLGQARRISDYSSATITVAPAFLAVPADDDQFVVKPFHETNVGYVLGTVQTAGDLAALITTADTAIDGVKAVTDLLPDAGALDDLALILADTGTDGVVLAADAITAAKIADNAIATEHIATGAISADSLAADTITAAKVAADVHAEAADAMWDEAKVGHVGAGSFGEEVQAHALSTEIAALNDLSGAEVNTEVLDVLATDTFAESSGIPGATATLVAKIGWLATLARNKITQTATTQLVRNDADDGTVATSTVSDDGTTAIRGEFV